MLLDSLVLKGGWLTPGKGSDAMIVFEALMLAIAFATLVITILTFNHKK